MAAKSDAPSAIPKVIAGRYRAASPHRARGHGRGLRGRARAHRPAPRAQGVAGARGRVPPELLERFKREARASARIKSEHVVRVTDADVAPELGGAPFLVMELLEGRTSRRWRGGAAPTPPSWSTGCARSRARSTRRTAWASSTAISSRRTCSSPDAEDRPADRQGARLRHRQDDRGRDGTTRGTGEVLGTPALHGARAGDGEHARLARHRSVRAGPRRLPPARGRELLPGRS